MTAHLDDLPAPMRTLVGLFAGNLALGYTAALLHVWSTTRLRPDGIATRYRGNEADLAAVEIAYPKSLEEMLGLSHTHILGMAVFLFAMAALALASRRGATKWGRLVAFEPLVALPVSMAGLWLAWGFHPGWTWLVSVSSGSAALAFYAQIAIVLRTCVSPKKGDA